MIVVVEGKAVLVEPCPECHAGKCDNCDGGSWDTIGDQPWPCPCAESGHPRKTAAHAVKTATRVGEWGGD